NWSARNQRKTLAWLRDGKVVSMQWLEGPRTDFFAFWDIEAEKREALVSELGATRNVPLAKEYGEPLDATSWIELERDECAPKLCAAYVLRVGGDGSVAYTGKSGV